MANAVTLKSNPISIGGNIPTPGQTARGFELANAKRETVTLDTYAGKRKVLNIFPSIDTPTCATSVREFNKKRPHSTILSCFVFQLIYLSHKAASAVLKALKMLLHYLASVITHNLRLTTA